MESSMGRYAKGVSGYQVYGKFHLTDVHLLSSLMLAMQLLLALVLPE